jgi:hypothetical protein
VAALSKGNSGHSPDPAVNTIPAKPPLRQSLSSIQRKGCFGKITKKNKKRKNKKKKNKRPECDQPIPFRSFAAPARAWGLTYACFCLITSEHQGPGVTVWAATKPRLPAYQLDCSGFGSKQT